MTDALHVGDIIGCKVSGAKLETILKMVDTKDYVKNGTGCSWGVNLASKNLESRDGVAFGNLASADTDENTMIKIDGGASFAVDPGYYVTVYDAKSGDVIDDETVSELVPYDAASNTGDKVFVRQHRMAIREIFVIRFE